MTYNFSLTKMHINSKNRRLKHQLKVDFIFPSVLVLELLTGSCLRVTARPGHLPLGLFNLLTASPSCKLTFPEVILATWGGTLNVQQGLKTCQQGGTGEGSHLNDCTYKSA